MEEKAQKHGKRKLWKSQKRETLYMKSLLKI